MEVTLKSNGWHRKLQTFVFPNAPKYNSLCPYFWLTVFCAIFTFIIPIVPIIKLVKLFMLGTTDLFNYINKVICVSTLDAIIKKMEESDLLNSWAAYSFEREYAMRYTFTNDQFNDWAFWVNDVASVQEVSSRIRKKQLKRFERWKELNPNWKEIIDNIKTQKRAEYEKRVEEAKIRREERFKQQEKLEMEKWRKRREEEEKSQKTAERRRLMFTKIAVYTKWLAYAIAAALIVAILYGAYCLYLYLITANIPWRKIGEVILVALSIIAASYFTGLLITGSKLLRRCNLSLDESKLAKVLNKVGQGIMWTLTFIYKYIIKPIGKLFSFIGMYIKSTKDGYCPAINWEEESNK